MNRDTVNMQHLCQFYIGLKEPKSLRTLIVRVSQHCYSPISCPNRDIILGTNWNPIPALIKHPSVTAIADRQGKRSAQIILRWHWQQGVVVNPRTSDPGQMMENMSIFDFELVDNQDMIIRYSIIDPCYVKREIG
jgi:hypothetical protein